MMLIPTTRFLARAVLTATAVTLASCDAGRTAWTDEAISEPRVFAPGVISTGDREYGITFTPDGNEAYFTRRSRRGAPHIFYSRFEEAVWTEPALAPFSSDRDEAPFITADGSRMLFSSRRPSHGTGDRSENIWLMERLADGWADPRPLAGVVNQPRSEFEDFVTGTESGPIVIANGSLLYWTRVDPDWGSDLYVADLDERGDYVSPRPLRINSNGDETNPAMSPDGRHLIFQGYRDARGFGEQDLYLSRRTDFGWSDPQLLPVPINSAGNDGYPSFSPDGRLFFFASDRSSRAGFYDILLCGRRRPTPD